MATLGAVRVSWVSIASRLRPGIAVSRRLLHTTEANASGGDHSWAYRGVPDTKKIVFRSTKIKGEIVMGAMWWWMLWHIFTEPEHLFGEAYPEAKKWTDEELGIPPDDLE